MVSSLKRCFGRKAYAAEDLQGLLTELKLLRLCIIADKLKRNTSSTLVFSGSPF